jgi:hypothetical protein
VLDVVEGANLALGSHFNLLIDDLKNVRHKVTRLFNDTW